MIKYIVGALCGIGFYFLLADIFKIPYLKTRRAVANLSKNQKNKTSVVDEWLKGIASFLSKRIKLNEFKKEELKSDLKTAQMDITPEMFKANAIVKSVIIGILAVPVAFIFPLLVPVVLFMAVFLYIREMKSVSIKIKAKREKIEYELEGLVFTIEKTLKHSRDVLNILETYMKNAGDDLRHELLITTADMRSGNYESALVRLESRVGSSQMSDVVRGLIGILRGDDTSLYWTSLSLKFNDIERQKLRLKASKVPSKVKRLSMCLLFCFMLIYIVVIVAQIMNSMNILFT